MVDLQSRVFQAEALTRTVIPPQLLKFLFFLLIVTSLSSPHAPALVSDLILFTFLATMIHSRIDRCIIE
jgi:hypothetical protein